jgi:hypothetical protein
MGTPSAQAIRRSVHDALYESSGVYAIEKPPPLTKKPSAGQQMVPR